MGQLGHALVRHTLAMQISQSGHEFATGVLQGLRVFGMKDAAHDKGIFACVFITQGIQHGCADAFELLNHALGIIAAKAQPRKDMF